MSSIAVRWSAVLVLFGPALACAGVTQFVIESRTLLDNGATFGKVGQYERLRGYAVGELDLFHPSRIFPDGVCDWSKRGVSQTGVVPWASFGPSPDNLVFDITRRDRRRDDDDDDD